MAAGEVSLRSFEGGSDDEGGRLLTLGCMQGEQAQAEEASDDSLMDLIAASAQQAGKKGEAAGVQESKKSSGKRKGGQK